MTPIGNLQKHEQLLRRLHQSVSLNAGLVASSLELPHHIHDLELEQIAHYVLVTRQQGFTLAWDGHSGSVYIKLSPEFVGRTCGLCGNFNADVQDDLKTSYGMADRSLRSYLHIVLIRSNKLVFGIILNHATFANNTNNTI